MTFQSIVLFQNVDSDFSVDCARMFALSNVDFSVDQCTLLFSNVDFSVDRARVLVSAQAVLHVFDF